MHPAGGTRWEEGVVRISVVGRVRLPGSILEDLITGWSEPFCLSWCRLGTARRLLWIAEYINFCPQPLICCLIELSYAVSPLPLSFSVQVQGLAQQCEKPQGREHKEQQEERRASNGLDVGSILLSTVWLWELPPLWDRLPLLFLPPSVTTSFPVCKMLCMFFSAGKFCVLA